MFVKEFSIPESFDICNRISSGELFHHFFTNNHGFKAGDVVRFSDLNDKGKFTASIQLPIISVMNIHVTDCKILIRDVNQYASEELIERLIKNSIFDNLEEILAFYEDEEYGQIIIWGNRTRLN